MRYVDVSDISTDYALTLLATSHNFLDQGAGRADNAEPVANIEQLVYPAYSDCHFSTGSTFIVQFDRFSEVERLEPGLSASSSRG